MAAQTLAIVGGPGSDGGRPAVGDHTWAAARRLAFDCARPLGLERVPLGEANGRTLAADLITLQEMPHYASSAMDGWAVCGDGPRVLREPGMPLGSSHAILMVDGSAPAGEVLIPAGTTLNPAHVALAAVAGFDRLEVRGKPLVKILVSGSEVVTSRFPAAGQVRDAFGPPLGTVIGMLGGTPGPLVRIGDSYEEWLTGLGAAEAPMAQWPDVVVTTGGTGRFGADHFRKAIAALGGRLLIDGVAVRPGHPAALAKLPNGRFIIGLPGDPLAALMALFTVGGPLLAALGHQPLAETTQVPCGETISAHPASTRLMPFRWISGLAVPARYAGPGMLRGLAAADGFLVIPARGAQRGEPVAALGLPWRPEL
ncbi:molybdopterin-binding protein [Arthrobacter sp. UNC362MFTsu5.1]|uniref:molybdopterin-binding protein n=1 Tax=Arthrobacter sp. UNC362MFTsu5.1 TaxID=1449044 RepID=UPI00068C42D6